MRVIFFMQDTGAIYGAERATLDLAHGLRAAGEDPLFFLIREARRGGVRSLLAEEIQRASFRCQWFEVRGRLSWSLARAVRRAFAANRGDVLHVIGYKANLHALLSGVRPVVATVHGWLFRADRKERLYDAIDQWCLRRCDRVICLSSFYRDWLLRHGVTSRQLQWIPSGLRELPPREITEKPVDQKHPVTFGMMGRFSDEKNHRFLIQSAKQAWGDASGVRIKLAGAGPLESQVRAWVQQEELSDRVEFCGYCPVDDFFSSIDVYVICSRIENLPYSILEAMAWGKPVIGTRVGGIPDLIEDQVNGLLVDLDNQNQMIEALQSMARHTERRQQWGRAGRLKVETQFTLDRCVENHRELYRELPKACHD